MTSNFAAAGLAEASLSMGEYLLLFALGVVVAVTLFAFTLQSQGLAVMVALLFRFATLFMQPWYCFLSFEETAYADTDGQAAARTVWTVGVTWVVIVFAVVGSSLFAFVLPHEGPPVAALPADGSGGSV